MSALGEHGLQSLGLRDGAGEAVEDHAVVIAAERVVDAGEHVDDELIGHQLSLVDVLLGGLAELCSVLNLAA